jgi:hypothetical protein
VREDSATSLTAAFGQRHDPGETAAGAEDGRMIFGNRKVKDCAMWQLQIVAFLNAVRMLPTTFLISYRRFLLALMKAR